MRYPLHARILTFVSGFNILALEFVGIRLFAPYLGTAVPVWASLMGVFLFASTVGYYAGGAMADRFRKGEHLIFIELASGILVIATSYTKSIIALIASQFSYGVGALISSFLVFFLPVLLLSAVTISIIRVSTKSIDKIAQIHGDLYAIATMGSLCGVFITSYILVPLFSLPTITLILGGSVVAATLYANSAAPRD